MNRRWWTCVIASGWLVLAAVGRPGSLRAVAAENSPPPKILIIAGPCQHPPGTHEAAAGARLLKHLLENAKDVRAVRAEVLYDWPEDKQLLKGTRTIVFLTVRHPRLRVTQ